MARSAHRTTAEASDTARRAGDTARNGLQTLTSAVSETIPAAGNVVSRAVYTTSFVVSYGFVFPMMLVARAVPGDNALVRGLVDGANAAREQVAMWGGGENGVTDEADSEASSDQNGRRRRKPRQQKAHSHGGRRASHSDRKE